MKKLLLLLLLPLSLFASENEVNVSRSIYGTTANDKNLIDSNRKTTHTMVRPIHIGLPASVGVSRVIIHVKPNQGQLFLHNGGIEIKAFQILEIDLNKETYQVNLHDTELKNLIMVWAPNRENSPLIVLDVEIYSKEIQKIFRSMPKSPILTPVDPAANVSPSR